jgi:uncharacterized membrane protein (UPF0136 family)
MATPGMQPSDGTQSRVSTLSETAKTLRDFGIASPVLFYTCGFVVLGCYSLDRNLGLQAFPATQLLSAGTGFVVILCLFAAVVLLVRKVLAAVFRWMDSGIGSSQLVRNSLLVILVGGAAMNWLFSKLHMNRTASVAAAIVASTFFLWAEGWVRRLARLYVYFFAFLMCLLVLTWYAFIAYPVIPASFGGGKPRHAHIQVDVKSISPGLSQQLFLPAQVSLTGIGELEADIYLLTDNTILLTTQKQSPADTGPEARKGASSIVLQLRRSDVGAILWDSR